MIKVMAVLRTVFLVFIVVLTFRAMPWFLEMARTHDESYARCTASVGLLSRAAWISVAWIAFETAVGWWMATRNGRKARLAKLEPDLPRPGSSEPPFSPPR
jgi:hypothetical protein